MSDVVKPPPCTEVWVLELKVRAGASRANQANTVIDQEGGPQIARAKVVRMSSQLRTLASIASLLREAELSARPAALWLFEAPRPRSSATCLNHRKKHARSVLGIVIDVNMPAARLGRGDL